MVGCFCIQKCIRKLRISNRSHGSIGSRIRKRAKKSPVWEQFSIWYHSQPCFYCQTEMDSILNSKKQRTADHILPFKAGGELSRNNLIPCCNECNNIRGNMDFITYGIIHILSKSYHIDVEKTVRQYDLKVETVLR